LQKKCCAIFKIQNWLERFNIRLPEVNKVNIILGIDDNVSNFIILIYKLSLYKARENGKVPSLSLFKNSLKHYEYIENKVAKAKQVEQNN